MTKAKKVTLVVFSFLFGLFSAIAVFWHFGDNYQEFYALAEESFAVEGLSDGFTPQGLTYVKSNDQYLTCGYMSDGSASRIYVVDASTNQTIKYFTLKIGDEDYVGHAGGIATDEKSVWVAGDKQVVRFDFDEISSVENAEEIKIIDIFSAPNGADFLEIEGDNLWIGEFHKEDKYETDPSHHIVVGEDKNMAISFCYKINYSSEYGFESELPISALSTCSQVQGMSIVDDKIVLSTSYSLPASRIKVYNNILANEPQSTFDFNGTNIDLYLLGSEHLLEEIEAPSMSEEIVENNDKLYVLFENGCKKYGYITREQNRNVYSIEISELG